MIGVLCLAAALLVAAGCGGDQPAMGDPGGGAGAEEPASPGTPAPGVPGDARGQLAALAAAAKDRRTVAFYTLHRPDAPEPGTVVVTLAADGSWRVDVPGGAHGGAVDVGIVTNANGLYQCVLPSVSQPGSCVRVADPGGAMPAAVDPRVPHIFTTWREVFTDRRAPLSVSPAEPFAGVSGACYSVESTAASLLSPVAPGIYCYTPDGTLTGARTEFGPLVLAWPPGAAPPTVPLPAPVVDGDPLPTAPPPSENGT